MTAPEKGPATKAEKRAARLKKASRKSLIQGAVMLGSLLIATSVLITVAIHVAQANGGNIEPDILRSGTASDVRCSPRLLALGQNWQCTAGDIDWQFTGPRPRSVELQTPPYYVLAKQDFTGKTVEVFGHARPKASSSLKTDDGPEIILAAGHPSGSAAWGAFRAFAPVVGTAALVGALLVFLKVRDLWRRRRPRSRKQRK